MAVHHLPVFGEQLPSFPGMMIDHLPGPAMHPVDAEHQIKRGPNKRPDPTHANPPGTGRRIPFMPQRMERHADGKRPAKKRQNTIQNGPVPHKTPNQAEAILFPQR